MRNKVLSVIMCFILILHSMPIYDIALGAPASASSRGYDINSAQDISNNDNITLVVNEETFLKWNPDLSYSDIRGVWSITSGSDVIEITSYEPQDIDDVVTPEENEPTYRHWYAKVKALKTGEADVKFTWFKGANRNGTRGEVNIHFTVNDEGFWIEDQVALNGCLVPAGLFNTAPIYKFQWSRSDGETINPNALDEEQYAVHNGVNIAIDRGGITDADRAYKTYTLTGLDRNGNIVTVEDTNGSVIEAKATFTVKYGMEIINGGFETPVIPESASIHRQYTNGEAGVYWATTGTGEVRDNGNGTVTDMLGHDIEIFTDKYGTMAQTYSGLTGGLNYIGTHNNMSLDADGSFTVGGVKYTNNKGGTGLVDNNYQAAELNCEAYGALYQDIISSPGSELSWSISHAARYNETHSSAAHAKDHMCVIIMSTEHGRHITSKNDIDELLKAAGYIRGQHTGIGTCNCGLPQANQGKQFTATIDGIDMPFQIWDCIGSYDKWTLNKGSYNVPVGQYSTRMMFAAAVSITDNLAGGNFIDGVSFYETTSYSIEYYTKDNADEDWTLHSDLTETAEANIGDIIHAANTNHPSLSEYTLAFTDLNGFSYGMETSFPLKTSATGEAPVLRLYYIESGISVTKTITGLDNTLTLTKLQRLLNGYVSTLWLYSNEECTNAVGKAVLDFSDGILSKTAIFNDINTGLQFIPNKDTTYWVKEESTHNIPGYLIDTEFPILKSVNIGASAVGSVEVVNNYTIDTSYDDESIITSKTISSEADGLWINLEAYGTGESTAIKTIVPADVIFVLDESGSMHKPSKAVEDLAYNTNWGSGANGVYNQSDEAVWDDNELQQVKAETGLITRSEFEEMFSESNPEHSENLKKASQLGYFIGRAAGVGSTNTGHWLKMQYNPEYGKWQAWKVYRTNYPTTSTNIEDTYIDSNGNPATRYRSEPLKVNGSVYFDLADLGNGYRRFYKTQYGEMYDAVISLVDTLNESGVNHRVGIVGFSGDDNIRVLSSGGVDQGLLSITEEQAKISSAISNVNSNYYGTCLSGGIYEANNIFEANPLNSNEYRDRIMIIITDGEPTGSFGYTEHGTHMDNAVYGAYITKNTYEALVYSIGTSAMTNDNFLHYTSSEYPYATSLNNTGDKVDGDYCYICSDAGTLVNIVRDISDNIAIPKVVLDSTAILLDVLSLNFKADASRDIQLLTSAYNGMGFNDAVSDSNIDIASDNVVGHCGDGCCELQAISNPNGTIEVKGFNYSKHFVAEGVAGGYKLIVKIPVVPSDSNTGGIMQATNEYSGIYYGGEKVQSFGTPYIDTPSTITVTKIIDSTAHDTNFEFTVNYGEFKGYGESIIGPDGSNYLPAIWEDKTITKQLGNNESLIIENVKPENEDTTSTSTTVTITEEVPEGYYSKITVYVDGNILDESEYTINDNGITVDVRPNMVIEIFNYSSNELPVTGGYSGILSMCIGVAIIINVAVIIRSKKFK